jgi:hypothetical protein
MQELLILSHAAILSLLLPNLNLNFSKFQFMKPQLYPGYHEKTGIFFCAYQFEPVSLLAPLLARIRPKDCTQGM